MVPGINRRGKGTDINFYVLWSKCVHVYSVERGEEGLGFSY